MIDPEGLLKEYLAGAGTAAYVGFAVPEKGTPPLPMVVLGQTGGAPDHTGQGTFTVRVEVYAAGGQAKRDASVLAGQVADALVALEDTPFTGSSGRLQGGGVSTVAPASGRKLTTNVTAKRYVVLGWVYATP